MKVCHFNLPDFKIEIYRNTFALKVQKTIIMYLCIDNKNSTMHFGEKEEDIQLIVQLLFLESESKMYI